MGGGLRVVESGGRKRGERKEWEEKDEKWKKGGVKRIERLKLL